MSGRASPDVVARAAATTEASRHLREASQRCRWQLRRRLDEVVDELDRARARRTVPRGQDASDESSTPGVALDVWLAHVRYQRSHRPDHLQVLVEEYEQYALSLARRLRRDRDGGDDLDQVALEALVVALQRFDCERGIPFPAFATPTILGALRRHYRDHGWGIRVPRRVHELAGPRREATERLTARLGREPTDDEVAAELGVGVDELRSAGEAAAARNPASLDVATVDEGVTAHEVVGEADPELVGADDRVALARAVEHLGERDREIIRLYFFEELTQSQIAERYGVSQMQVSRWVTSILARLRARME